MCHVSQSSKGISWIIYDTKRGGASLDGGWASTFEDGAEKAEAAFKSHVPDEAALRGL